MMSCNATSLMNPANESSAGAQDRKSVLAADDPRYRHPRLGGLRPIDGQSSVLHSEHRGITEATQELIDYYEAIELVLPSAREAGIYRTHFGMMDNALPEDYCYLKTIFRPAAYPKYCSHVIAGMNALHRRIFNRPNQYEKVLDVGCGTAGTLKLLATEWKDSALYGVNINRMQLGVASQHCRSLPNIHLINEDFLRYTPNARFDLIYFIESAFHIKNKQALSDNISQLLTPGGEVYIIDLFYSSRLPRSIAKFNGGLFHYQSVDQWKELFSGYDLELFGYDDISAQVANHISISSTLDDFRKEVSLYYLAEHPRRQEYLECLDQVYVGYSRLGKMLRKRQLEYGVLRLRKGWQ